MRCTEDARHEQEIPAIRINHEAHRSAHPENTRPRARKPFQLRSAPARAQLTMKRTSFTELLMRDPRATSLSMRGSAAPPAAVPAGAPAEALLAALGDDISTNEVQEPVRAICVR